MTAHPGAAAQRHGTLHRPTTGTRPRGHLRRDRVRLRHHSPRRRSREVHAAALGDQGAGAPSGVPRSGLDKSIPVHSSCTSSADLLRLRPRREHLRPRAARRCPWSSTTSRARCNSSALGMLFAVVLSIPLGVLASRKPGGPTDRMLTTLSLDRSVDAAVLPRLRAADRLHREAALVRDPGPDRGPTT